MTLNRLKQITITPRFNFRRQYPWDAVDENVKKTKEEQGFYRNKMVGVILKYNG